MKKYLRTLILFLIICTFLTGCNDNKEKAQTLYLSAMQEYTIYNLDGAWKYADAAFQLDHSLYQAKFLKAKILFFKKDYDKSNKIFEELIKKHPEFVEARIWNIRCLILSAKYEEAEKKLEHEVSFNSTDWRIFYLYSLLYNKQNLLDKEIIMLNNAEMSLKDAAKVYTSEAELWGMLGLTDREKKSLEKAKIIGDFEEFLNEEN